VRVNVSGKQLQTAGIVQVVRDALERHRTSAESLILEITEAVAVTSTSLASDILAHLRGLGVRIALDDFGTGFSSLRTLDDLPVDIIKIDRSFVSDRACDNTAILEAIVTLGRGLNLQMIAEGIEQPSELERVRRLGVPLGQGYLFARPLTVEDASWFAACKGARQSGDRLTDLGPPVTAHQR
jgi:EAL domain-containing protein (putative c-di-GMP-specific phosphodiesterase class I)